jgi:hypothetical protein
MEGWPLPPESRDVPGDGPFNGDPDKYDFAEGDRLPKHFIHWRVPRPGVFSISDAGLSIVPSRNNLTGIPFYQEDIALTGQRGLSFVGRRQTHTLFSFSVDVKFNPTSIGQEAGITVFLTQVNHIDIGVALLDSGLSLRFRAEGTGTRPAPVTVPVPESWFGKPIRLHITATDPYTYALAASLGCGGRGQTIELAEASSGLVSGGNGSFVGSLLGAWATCNGAGEGEECPDAESGTATFQRWRYTPVAQFISEDESVPVQ